VRSPYRFTHAGAVAATVLLTLLAFAGPAQARVRSDDPPPDKVVIDLVNVNGSGCPRGTAAVSVSEDKTAFTVTYSAYLAQVGIGSTPTSFRRNCQLGLRVHVPQGFTYAVAQADYRGFASLAAGATGLHKASYYFQGASLTPTIEKAFAGPLSDNWQQTEQVGVLAWAPCDAFRDLNVNSELRVDAGTSDPATTTSLLSMDSTDVAFSTLFQLSWRRC
jgi:hypothetical protein